MSSTLSSSSSSFNRGFHDRVLCGHEIAASIDTSHTQKNPERRFYRCCRRMSENCGFWRWLDPELSTYYKMTMNNIILQRDKAYEELKFCKLMGEMQSEKYEEFMTMFELKCAEVEEMKIVMKDQELQSKNLEWKFRITAFMLVLVLCSLALTILC